MIRKAVIATRGSQLALWQSNWIADRLREIHPGIEVELLVRKTSGDRFLDASLQVLGGKGAFTKEITEAVLGKDADLAVHSLKDLPTQPVPGLRVWAYPVRFDPRDAWFGRNGLAYGDLPPGSVVATGSLRRAALIRHRHPETRIEPIRGNVESRIRKFEEGSMAGMFLAAAGLDRLGLSGKATEKLDPLEFVPAPGQGCLAVEGRDDPETEVLLSPLDHPETRVRILAERGFLSEMEAGCQVPLGAHAVIEGNDLVLRGKVLALDGSRAVEDTARGALTEADSLGRDLARRLLDQGAGEILEAIRESGAET